MEEQRTIFVLGITQRSGTNFLYNLLRLHPDVTASPPWEDFLVSNSNFIMDYCSSVTRYYGPELNIPAVELSKYIGYGLLAFLHRQSEGKWFVTKSPSVRNIHNFFSLFPGCKLLILIRDGRAVVESGVRSFGWDYDQASREWVAGAKKILEFERTYKETIFFKHYRIVKYEDLHQDTENELLKICQFLGLDANAIDLNDIQTLPVRGSSQYKREMDEEIRWKPFPKTDDFDPMNRWKIWNKYQTDRFNWIAGSCMDRFDYALVNSEVNPKLSIIRNHLLDWNQAMRERIRNGRNYFTSSLRKSNVN